MMSALFLYLFVSTLDKSGNMMYNIYCGFIFVQIQFKRFIWQKKQAITI